MVHRIYVVPIFVFPLLLIVGILTIPIVSDYSDHILAEKAVSQTGRWFWGHLISAVAFGSSSLAAYSIFRRLSEKGQVNSGMVSLVLITIGSSLFSCGLGADGIGPLATMAGDGRAYTFFEGSGMWVSGIFIAASIIFSLGLFAQLVALINAGILKGIIRIIVFGAAIVFCGATVIPSGWGLYVVVVAVLVIYIPIGYVYWRESS